MSVSLLPVSLSPCLPVSLSTLVYVTTTCWTTVFGFWLLAGLWLASLPRPMAEKLTAAVPTMHLVGGRSGRREVILQGLVGGLDRDDAVGRRVGDLRDGAVGEVVDARGKVGLWHDLELASKVEPAVMADLDPVDRRVGILEVDAAGVDGAGRGVRRQDAVEGAQGLGESLGIHAAVASRIEGWEGGRMKVGSILRSDSIRLSSLTGIEE